MTDREMWDRAVAQVAGEYATLPVDLRLRAEEAVSAIMRLKAELHSAADAVNAGEICARCGGECCARGKYHFTVVDLLAFLATEATLFEPRFESDSCPYFGDHACMMVPAHRPFNCVTFNCELVEGLWGPEPAERFRRGEKELRRLYDEVDALFANRFRHGLLMNYERDVVAQGGQILGNNGR